MDLVEERNSWYKEFEEGEYPLGLEIYKSHRDTNSWRNSRMFEKVCEYCIYLEGKLDDKESM